MIGQAFMPHSIEQAVGIYRHQGTHKTSQLCSVPFVNGCPLRHPLTVHLQIDRGGRTGTRWYA